MAQDSTAGNSFDLVLSGLEFPEGPAWDGKGNLFVSSCYGGYITKISDEGSSKFIDSTQQPFKLKQSNGLTFGSDGFLYACDYGIGAVLKISPEGNTTILAPGFEGSKFNRPNDLAFDAEGNLFFTDPKSYGAEVLDGAVYRLSPDGSIKRVLKDLAFPNGIALSSDGSNLFVCESAKNRVLKYSLDKEGLPHSQQVFIELPGGDPDGIAFDVDGNLYVAHFGSGTIFVVNPEGKIIRELKTPGKKPSNVEFGGKDLKTLFITEDETNSVYKTSVETPGLKLFNSPG